MHPVRLRTLLAYHKQQSSQFLSEISCLTHVEKDNDHIQNGRGMQQAALLIPVNKVCLALFSPQGNQSLGIAEEKQPAKQHPTTAGLNNDSD